MIFDLKPITNNIDTIITLIITTLFLILIYGKNNIKKLIGIIILEYSSSFVAKVSGINKNPRGKKYLNA